MLPASKPATPSSPPQIAAAFKTLPWVKDVKIEANPPDALVHLLIEKGKFDQQAVKDALEKTKFKGGDRVQSK